MRDRPPKRAGQLPGGARLIHEDADLLVVDKPAGLLTIATDRERRRTLYALLRERLRREGARVFIVHRLDRDASGVIVFARTPEAKRHLQAQFESREAGRRYLAVVHGVIARDETTLRSRLAENAAFRVYETPRADRGKPAVTHVRVLRRGQRRTLVEVRLETGRKHQIRVQLAGAGHPIVGDRRYGDGKDGARRLALHAASLAFRHPATGKRMEFDCRTPPGFPTVGPALRRR